LTNKEFAAELDINLDQVFVYDVSAGELKKTYLSEITAFGETGYTGSQGDLGYTGSQGESSFTWGDTAPVSPVVGDRWFDTVTGALTVYTDDGDTTQWVEVAASGFIGATGYTGSSGGVNTVTTFPTTINSNVTISSGENALSIGPIAQDAGTVVTITAGQRWIIL
jgi:hypothetical protein